MMRPSVLVAALTGTLTARAAADAMAAIVAKYWPHEYDQAAGMLRDAIQRDLAALRSAP